MLVCSMCFHLLVIIQTKTKWRCDWYGYLKRSWYFIPLKANEKIGASGSLQILQIAFIIRVLVFASVGVWNSHLYLSRKHCKDLIKLLQLDSRYGYLTRFWSCTHFQILVKISILIFVEINIAPYRRNNSIPKEKPVYDFKIFSAKHARIHRTLRISFSPTPQYFEEL